MKKVLTIAGSDCSGGAGIQADLKTMTAHGVYGMSVITALTAQNTTGVYGISEVTPDFVQKQLNCIFEDIFPDAVKIGMTSSSGIIEIIADKLAEINAQNTIVDPVMIATSGSRLMSEEAVKTLTLRLFPLAALITPNIPEAEVLSEISITCESEMLKAAEAISSKFPCAVLIKGGHLSDEAADLLYKDGSYKWFRSKRINNPNTHGTGCTLSSAIACNLALGKTLEDSVSSAKRYISEAIAAGLNLGNGNGPLNHMYALTKSQ